MKAKSLNLVALGLGAPFAAAAAIIYGLVSVEVVQYGDISGIALPIAAIGWIGVSAIAGFDFRGLEAWEVVTVVAGVLPVAVIEYDLGGYAHYLTGEIYVSLGLWGLTMVGYVLLVVDMVRVDKGIHKRTSSLFGG